MHILITSTKDHNPQFEVFNGDKIEHQEVPARVERILAALDKYQLPYQSVEEMISLELLKEVHEPLYVDFLVKKSHQQSENNYAYPSAFPIAAHHGVITNDIATHGKYSFDTYTPILKYTADVARKSAYLAWKAAQLIREGSQKSVYALCRPPGHHAERAQMGGYCYFNNAAIAAHTLSKKGKVATLDVDFHHGNGTQHIFSQREDIFTSSIHADTDWKFPFMAGNKNEPGIKANSNYPLLAGVTDKEYQVVLEEAVKKISDFNPDYLVVSLGLDTHEADPIGGFKLTTPYYQKMGQTIVELSVPTVIVQEGGYNTGLLGENVISFLKGFET